MSKICPFFSASAFASCAFLLFLSNSQSFGNLLVRWNLCHLASLKQTYTTLLTIPMHKDLSRGTFFFVQDAFSRFNFMHGFSVWKRFRSNKTFLLCSPFDVKTPKANSEAGFCQKCPIQSFLHLYSTDKHGERFCVILTNALNSNTWKVQLVVLSAIKLFIERLVLLQKPG